MQKQKDYHFSFTLKHLYQITSLALAESVCNFNGKHFLSLHLQQKQKTFVAIKDEVWILYVQ